MALKPKNDTVKVEERRPPEAEDYMPEKDSALLAASEQARGEARNERDKNDVRKHNHDGTNSEKIQLRDIAGFFEIVSAVPTHTPKSFYDQIKIYVNGATLELYVYDPVNDDWYAATLA